MIVAVNQPTYLPWLGYFELIAHADCFVLLDTAQYVHHEWNNRNRLKGSNGNPFWLTVPIVRAPLETTIKDIQIASDPPNRKWRKKHLGSMTNALSKTPYFTSLQEGFDSLINAPYRKLVDLNIALIMHIVNLLGIDTPIIKASELGLEGRRTELLKNICDYYSADVYYSPAGAAAYLEEEKSILTNAGVELRYQAWEHPIYQQLYGDFVSHLSVLDCLMNVGPDKTGELIDGRE